jgi:AcrR family transcriptional regulator
MTIQDDHSEVSVQHEAVSRLLQATASVCGEKGVAMATIADIVREAGVSKRTFYEHFESKDACFLALYRASSGSALRALRVSIDDGQPWQHQVETALWAYLAYLSAAPDLSKMLFVEIHHLGPAGIQLRRKVMQQFADFILNTVNSVDRGAAQQTLTPGMALAAVGAINELILQALEQGKADRLQLLTPVASEIVRLLTQEGSNPRP